MKKFLLILTVTIVALCLAAPAMAALKLTTKGYMDVTGININNNIIDRGIGAGNSNDSANSWYQMEMIVDTTLHINDKVRIHGQFTVLERIMNGADQSAVANAFADYRGATDFYWERLYLSFPLFGGTLYVGRMGGGGWAYPFQDAKDNRDRIKYVRKVGHIVVLGVIEKLAELDGGQALTNAPVAGDSFDTSHGDVNSYAVGSIIPFSKNIIYKPLFYYIDRQNTAAAAGFGNADGYSAIFMQALMIKAGPFKLDAEVNYRWTDRKNVFVNPRTGLAEDWDEGLWSYWIDAGVTFGPAEIALGTFFLEGTDSADAWENQSLWGIGQEFQPLLLLTSEDCGLLFNAANVGNAMGVANGSSGRSGFEAYYLRAGYKISDSMKLSAILGYMKADEMMAGTHWDGVRSADDEIGWEFDIGFEWKFMPNIKYIAEFAYLAAGDYWDTFAFAGNGVGTDVSNDVWGMRHMLVINW